MVVDEMVSVISGDTRLICSPLISRLLYGHLSEFFSPHGLFATSLCHIACLNACPVTQQ